ncbi:MAG: polyprenyl synthetase family protein [Bryobacteraceae bacterium]|nr:polyprenyl synthetase family protein [Bryobacteraceae bacterium]MDW8378209.1 polyprenyl synthetase family protein [Bryobacterales bacterium]
MGFTSKLGQALTTREIVDLVRDDLKLVERELEVESVGSVEAVTQIARHLQRSGGKRLRPILLLLSARASRTGGDALPPIAIRMAAVVELIHGATLIHDDVIDVAQTRRGRPSSNVIWGNHVSVLSGDWLYMQAFQIALRERNFHILDMLINLTQMMVEGELLQLERIGKMDISEADYMQLIDRKTACLFSVCAKLGAHVAGASESFETRLGEYAWNVGIAFQLVDDVLDFTARESVLGKPVGSDLREGKVTLPLIYALETASEPERRKVATVLAEKSYQSVAFDEILAILERHRGIDRVRERAQQFTEKARAIIAEFPDSPYQRALSAVTDLVTDRDC